MLSSKIKFNRLPVYRHWVYRLPVYRHWGLIELKFYSHCVSCVSVYVCIHLSIFRASSNNNKDPCKVRGTLNHKACTKHKRKININYLFGWKWEQSSSEQKLINIGFLHAKLIRVSVVLQSTNNQVVKIWLDDLEFVYLYFVWFVRNINKVKSLSLTFTK